MSQFERMPPVFELLLFVKAYIYKGNSVYESVGGYINKNKGSQFTSELSQWLEAIDKKKSAVKTKSIHMQVLFEILEMGLEGQPILNKLNQFELRLSEAIDAEIELKLKKMPIYSLFPLLFFQLPSLMIIGFMPFLNKLSMSISG